MHTFQSKYRSLDLQLSNKKVVQFKNYEFVTDNDELASLIRKRLGNDVWELPTEVAPVVLKEETEKLMERLEENDKPKRRGRPPKVQLVQGMRTSQTQGEET